MTSAEELKHLLTVAVDAAKQAGAVLREHVGGRRDISFKGEINLVTEMDRRSEQIVVSTINEAFPEHGILAEEGACVEKRSRFRWIIDPLDGTTNYAHGYPNFSVSIGLEETGEIVAGVVYDPMRDELFAAVKGMGATLNGGTIRVSNTDSLIRSLLATGFPYDRVTSPLNNLGHFNRMIMASQEIRRSGSASLDLCAVAAGRLDGYWELKLQPWDTAAGEIIVREAGGAVSDFSGSGYNITAQEIIATNGVIHRQMLQVLLHEAEK